MSEISDAITYFISHLAYAHYFFPVDTLMEAFGYVLSFLMFWYTVKMVLFMFSFAPFVGRKIDLPTLHSSSLGDNYEEVRPRGVGDYSYYRAKRKK